MEKTYKVIGIAKCVIMHKGLLVQPKCKFEWQFNEKELNAFRDYIEVIEISDNSIQEQKVDSIIETTDTEEIKVEEEKVEVKQNVRRTTTKNRSNKD